MHGGSFLGRPPAAGVDVVGACGRRVAVFYDTGSGLKSRKQLSRALSKGFDIDVLRSVRVSVGGGGDSGGDGAADCKAAQIDGRVGSAVTAEAAA